MWTGPPEEEQPEDPEDDGWGDDTGAPTEGFRVMDIDLLDNFLQDHTCCAHCAAEGHKKTVTRVLAAFVEFAGRERTPEYQRQLKERLTPFKRSYFAAGAGARQGGANSDGFDSSDGADGAVGLKLGREWHRGLHSEFTIVPSSSRCHHFDEHVAGKGEYKNQLVTSRAVKTGQRGPQFWDVNVRFMYAFQQIGRGAEDAYLVAA